MGIAIPSDGDERNKEADPPVPSKSLDTLAAEATASAGGSDTELSREERARRALECDCVAELRDGPCGSQFSEAFYCFLTSTAEEQVLEQTGLSYALHSLPGKIICELGSDCIKPFIAMQTCMAANPDAFVQYSGEDSNNTNTEGECKPQDKKQDGPPVPTPPARAIRNPIL